MEYKGYNIKGDGTFGYKAIHTVGRGSLPNELRGVFSTATFAQRAIDIYLATKGIKNAEVLDSN